MLFSLQPSHDNITSLNTICDPYNLSDLVDLYLCLLGTGFARIWCVENLTELLRCLTSGFDEEEEANNDDLDADPDHIDDIQLVTYLGDANRDTVSVDYHGPG